MRNKYRIVTDLYAGYEAQVKRWWLPLWTQVGVDGPTNTFATVAAAEACAERHRNGTSKVVKYL